MARRRCSVETYSSPRDSASFCACCSTRPRRAEAESCTLPLTLGCRCSSVASADESCGQVLDVELRVTLLARLLLRGDERLLRLLGQFVRVYHFVTCLTGSAC